MFRENKKTKYSIRKTAIATVSLAVGLVIIPVVGTEKMVYAEEGDNAVEAAYEPDEIEKTPEVDWALPESQGEPDVVEDSMAAKTTPVNPVLTEVEHVIGITQDEKDKIAIEIGKANPELPEGTSVTVGLDGEVTFT